jgi:hypothetical protein
MLALEGGVAERTQTGSEVVGAGVRAGDRFAVIANHAHGHETPVPLRAWRWPQNPKPIHPPPAEQHIRVDVVSPRQSSSVSHMFK